MKKKIIKSVFWLTIVTIAIFALFNLIFLPIFNIKRLTNEENGFSNLIAENNYWTLPVAIGFGLVSGLLNFFEFKPIKTIKNFFSQKEEVIEDPFLIDQRKKKQSLTEFKKVVKENSRRYGAVVYWNKVGQKYNWYVLPEVHVRVIGSTGSNKSQFFILGNIFRNLTDPNLMIRPNMVVIDPKGELYENAFLYNQAAKHYNLIQIDFKNPESSISWNPLAKIWDLYHSNSEANQNLAFTKIQDFLKTIQILDESRSSSPSWPTGARLYLSGVLEFLLEYSKIDPTFTKNHFSIINLYTLAQDMDLFKNIAEKLINETNDDGTVKYPKIKKIISSIKSIIDADDGPRTSFQGIASTAIFTYASNRNHFQMIYKNEIDFKETFSRTKGKPTAYFISYPDDLTNIHPFISLLINEAYQCATEVARDNLLQGKAERLIRPLQLFIDEFGILPALPNFENWVNIARSRNIQLFIAYQSEQQLAINYSKITKVIEEGFVGSLLLSTSNHQTAEKFSNAIGWTKRKRESISSNEKDKTKSKNVSYQDEKILSPSQILQMDKNKYLLLINQHKPSILTKSYAWQAFKDVVDKYKHIKINKPSKAFNADEIYFDFHKLINQNQAPKNEQSQALAILQKIKKHSQKATENQQSADLNDEDEFQFDSSPFEQKQPDTEFEQEEEEGSIQVKSILKIPNSKLGGDDE